MYTLQAQEYNKPEGQFRIMLPPCVTDENHAPRHDV